MREMNEDASVYAGQRATAEAIERGGGGGLSVDALLAKVRTAAAHRRPVPTEASRRQRFRTWSRT
ncbi:hypothetical protein O1M63_52120 [Streptomyces mirabilis]|nr:hypothetical protein [Streptomyces mirabilis]